YNLLGNTETSEEIVSDVLLKIWIKREEITLIQDLRLYLFKAVKNASLNYLKSTAHRKDQLTGPVNHNDEPYISPESEYACTEIQNLILLTVNKLPPKCQMVFRLVKEYGLSYIQVGEVMNISQNTIETH